MAKTYKDQVLVSLQTALQDRSFEMKDLDKKTWPDDLRDALREFFGETPSVTKGWLSEMLEKHKGYIQGRMDK
jgi:hypothetical protein